MSFRNQVDYKQMPTLCASVRRRGCMDQCPARALNGHELCGRHARSKHVVLWVDANREKSVNLVKVQALIRGWLVRSRLALAGPGGLCRSNLANDDDLDTCQESSKEDPFTYFAFEESGKIWWFSFPTLWRWCLRNQEPTNPYTKVPLTTETRKRLRAIWAYNRRHRCELPPESPNPIERMEGRWRIISQVFHDNGFGDIDWSWFSRLTKRQFVDIFRMINEDIDVTISHGRVRASTRKFVTHALSLAHTSSQSQYLVQASYVLMISLVTPKDPYTLAFTILSAMYRC